MSSQFAENSVEVIDSNALALEVAARGVSLGAFIDAPRAIEVAKILGPGVMLLVREDRCTTGQREYVETERRSRDASETETLREDSRERTSSRTERSDSRTETTRRESRTREEEAKEEDEDTETDGEDTYEVRVYFAETEAFLRESIENGIFTQFIFTDGNKSEDLIDQIGAEALEGSVGTAPGSNPDNASTQAWTAAYIAEYGAAPTLPFVREAYDATIAIALAAEAAGSTDGEAIRDQLVSIAGPPGAAFVADAAGVAAALKAAGDGDDINFEGAATPIDWNAAGDVTSGFMEIWGYSGGELITIEIRAFNLN